MYLLIVYHTIHIYTGNTMHAVTSPVYDVVLRYYTLKIIGEKRILSCLFVFSKEKKKKHGRFQNVCEVLNANTHLYGYKCVRYTLRCDGREISREWNMSISNKAYYFYRFHEYEIWMNSSCDSFYFIFIFFVLASMVVQTKNMNRNGFK